jgi:hypothetical protein
MSEMDYLFAAHHEAGHAIVAEYFGATIDSLGLEPTPHCIPDVTGLDDESIAIICMGGAAGTLKDYGTMGPCETDITAARVYKDDYLNSLTQASAIIQNHRFEFDLKVANLIQELGIERAHDKAFVCVDTVKRVMQNGPDFNQGEKI